MWTPKRDDFLYKRIGGIVVRVVPVPADSWKWNEYRCKLYLCDKDGPMWEKPIAGGYGDTITEAWRETFKIAKFYRDIGTPRGDRRKAAWDKAMELRRLTEVLDG